MHHRTFFAVLILVISVFSEAEISPLHETDKFYWEWDKNLNSAMDKLGITPTDLHDIIHQVRSGLYKTFFDFLRSTGNMGMPEGNAISVDKQDFLGHDLPPNADYIILKGIRRMWKYGKWGLQFLILMGLIIMPQIGIALAASMIPVIFAAVWLPPNVDPEAI